MSLETSTTSVDRSIFAFLRKRLAQRADSEHEQALVRLSIAVIVFTYFFTSAVGDGTMFQNRSPALLLCILILLYSIGILAWIFINPKTSVVRRFFGMMTDLSATAYGMYLSGELGAPFFGVFLWATTDIRKRIPLWRKIPIRRHDNKRHGFFVSSVCE